MTKKKTSFVARAKLMFALPLALSMMLLISFSPDIIAQQDEKIPPPPPKKEKEVNKPVKTEKQTEVTIIQVVEHPGEQDDPPIFTVVEEMPKYPGGLDAMYKFFGENIKYPEAAKKNGVSGKVYVQFVVMKDGTPKDFKVLRGIGAGCDEEALRVMKLMPKWEPGKQRGKPVNVQYNLPIKFTLDDGDDKKKQEEKKKQEAEKK